LLHITNVGELNEPITFSISIPSSLFISYFIILRWMIWHSL
jgi:hypothetical protein